MHLILSTILALLVLYQNGYCQKKVDLSSDPSLLPYDFKSHQAIALDRPDAEYAPMYMPDQGRLGAYEILDHWHDDSLSFLIFWRDVLKGGAINQVNRNIWGFGFSYGDDIDSDGNFEVAIEYIHDKVSWIEVFEVGGKVEYKGDLSEVLYLKDRDRWDGAIIIQTVHDLNRDLSKEFIATVFTGYALYPRSVFCLDWKKDSILWNYIISGLPYPPKVIENKRTGKTRIVIVIVSMGNDVTAGDMDDRHSYILCLNERGEREWLRTLGGIFSRVHVAYLNLDDEGRGKILTATSFSESDLPSDSSFEQTVLRQFDPEGNLLKTIKLSPGISSRQLEKADIDNDGVEEALLVTSDNMITIYDDELDELAKYAFQKGIRIWKCMDFLGNGKTQIILATDEDEIILLNDKFRMLAKYDLKFTDNSSYVVETELSESSKTLLMKEADQARVAVLYFERKPVLAIVKGFVLRYQQTLFAILGILIVALVFTNYHRRKTKRNLDIISVQRDELEKTKAELESTLEDLKAAQIRLVQSEKMASLSMLVAGIAHEINNAVGALISDNNTVTRAAGRLRVTVRDAKSLRQDAEKLTAMLEMMESTSLAVGESAERISKIIKRLRSFARLDEAELQRVDINQCIDETLELMHSQLKQNILITKNYSDLKPITCYPSQLNQVFLNLILNAKDSIDGKGEINIETRQEDHFAVIKISDTGRGIPEKNLHKIFDPGFTTKGVGIGIGLGLSICYQIVQDHKGDIEVQSNSDKGTIVVMRLPMEMHR
ncbi:MAG: hypothetical protein GWN96_12310 [candidate division Zixibacteria bacterium]|nr:hypothetical protein [candidate division Zixibacteria bacterium]